MMWLPGEGWEKIGDEFIDFTFEYYVPYGKEYWNLTPRERWHISHFAPIRNKVYDQAPTH